MHPGRDDPGWLRRSRTNASDGRSAATPGGWGTMPPAGPFRSWPIISVRNTAILSRHVHFVGVGMNSACGGNDHGISMPTRTRTGRRKRGPCSPLERDAHRGGAARCGCDDLAVVSTATIHLGLSRRAGAGSDHRRECQASLVRSDQPSYGASSGSASAAATTGRLSGLSALPATTLWKSPAVVVAGSGLLSHGDREPTVGGPFGGDSFVAA